LVRAVALRAFRQPPGPIRTEFRRMGEGRPLRWHNAAGTDWDACNEPPERFRVGAARRSMNEGRG
jgi:hypothetical protein